MTHKDRNKAIYVPFYIHKGKMDPLYSKVILLIPISYYIFVNTTTI